MKNFAEKTATTLAIGLATMGNVDAKALETNNANNDIKKAKIELASDMITSNTHDKALKIVDFQNPAKLEVTSEKETIEAAKKLIKNLSAMDFTKRREYLEQNKDSINKITTDLKKIMERLNRYSNINRKKAIAVRGKHESNLGGEEMAKMYDRIADKAEKEWGELWDINSQIFTYIKELDLPTAEGMQFSSTVENKSPQVIELEKKLQMEIIKDEENQAYVVMHKNSIVSAIAYFIRINGVTKLGIKDKKIVLTFKDKEYGVTTLEYFERDGKLIEIASSDSELELFTLEKNIQKNAKSKNSVVINK